MAECVFWHFNEGSNAREFRLELQAACMSSVTVLVPALFGSLLLVVDTEHTIMSAQTTRGVVALSIFLIVTWSYEIGKTMSHFKQALAQATPSIVLVLLVLILCAVASKDTSNDKVADPATLKGYFDIMTHATTTCFRILVGEWHDVMQHAVAVTTEATQLWFYAISFLLSVLFAELVIGVIMSQYSKVNKMTNKRMQAVLDPIFEFRSTESEVLLGATLQLCRTIRGYNDISLQINKECDEYTQMQVQMTSGAEVTLARAPSSQPHSPSQDAKSVFSCPTLEAQTVFDCQHRDSVRLSGIQAGLEVRKSRIPL